MSDAGAHPLKWEALALALLASYVDGSGLLRLGTFVSFMSGNTTRSGVLTGLARLPAALHGGEAVACFVLGSFGGAWIVGSAWRPAWRVLMLFVAALLAVPPLASVPVWLAIAALATGMGMMNAALPYVGGEPVNVTFVTGTLHRLGVHLARACRGAPVENACGSGDTHLRRAALTASMWAAFVAGGVLSGIATPALGDRALFPACLALVALAGLPVPSRVPCATESRADGSRERRHA